MGGDSGPPCRQRHLQYATVALRVLCPRIVPLAHETCCHFWWLSFGRSHHRARLTRDLFGRDAFVQACGNLRTVNCKRAASTPRIAPKPPHQFLRCLRNQRSKGPRRHARVILLRCPLTKVLTKSCEAHTQLPRQLKNTRICNDLGPTSQWRERWEL